jgi:hypothetical protein
MLLQDGTNTYVYGLGLISTTNSSGAQTYYLKDGLRNTIALCDGSGNVTATYAYDVFGAVRAHTGGSTEFSFTGEDNDPNGLECRKTQESRYSSLEFFLSKSAPIRAIRVSHPEVAR